MSQTSSEADVTAAKHAAMGETLGELHFLLWKDLTWLHFEWHEYRELLAATEERVALMNEVAPRFFWSLDRVLWQDTLLGLSRLGDPPGTGGQRNVTLRRLPPLLTGTLRGNVNAALESFESRVAFARDWRHKRYAHREEQLAALPQAFAPKTATRLKVEDALDAASEVMNLCSRPSRIAVVRISSPAKTSGQSSTCLLVVTTMLARS